MTPNVLQEEWQQFENNLCRARLLHEEFTALEREARALPEVVAAELDMQAVDREAETESIREELAERIFNLRTKAESSKTVRQQLKKQIGRKKDALQELLTLTPVSCAVRDELELELHYLTVGIDELKRLRTVMKRCLCSLATQRATARTVIKRALQPAREKTTTAQQLLQQTWEQIKVWATQDRAHLDFFLHCQPKHHQDVIGIFADIHGPETVADLIPQSLHTKDEEGELLRRLPGDDSWQLVYVPHHSRTKRYTLPDDPSSALEMLRKLLEVHCRSAEADHTLQCLRRVTLRTVEKRSRMKRLKNTLPLNWRILRISQSIRAFLNINEQEKILEFTVENRKESYRLNRRPRRQR